jgi:dienelactone hydrolase
MRCKYFLALALAIILIAVVILVFIGSDRAWVVENIKFTADDGFRLEAYLLRPKNPRGKYPAIACFHQLWGNRDDFLKIFPYLANAGIVALAPDFPRQQPSYDPKRISDLRDALGFLENRPFVDKKKLGIITASFSVETGMTAILDKTNVIANVLISGQILREDSRKYLTLNSNLAIFPIASIYDGSNHLLMKEYLGRSLNPFSRHLFIDDAADPFLIQAHGTFVFDEVPQSMERIRDFFMDVFGIKNKTENRIRGAIPEHAVSIDSTDGFPVWATFRQPRLKSVRVPAVILYPPQFLNRRYYDGLNDRLVEKGIAVLAPDTKRTCRVEEKLVLCEREILGAIRFLASNPGIDPDRIAVVFPSFYYLIAKKMVENSEIPVKMVVFMETGRTNYGIRPINIDHGTYEFIYLDKPSLGRLKLILLNRL